MRGPIVLVILKATYYDPFFFVGFGLIVAGSLSLPTDRALPSPST